MPTPIDSREATDLVAQILHEGAQLRAGIEGAMDWLSATWTPAMPVPRWTAYYADAPDGFWPRLALYASNRSEYGASVRALAHGAPKTGDGAVHKAPSASGDHLVEATRQFGFVQVQVVMRPRPHQRGRAMTRHRGDVGLDVLIPAAAVIFVVGALLLKACLG